MGIYAGFLAQTDKEIDRLADTIKDTGKWDNTFLTGKSRDRSHLELESISGPADLKLLPPGVAVLARDKGNDSKVPKVAKEQEVLAFPARSVGPTQG
jgi:hypothetical protein